MLFTLIDVILIVLVAVFAVIGFMMGLIEAIGALIGLILGVFLANAYFMPVADWLNPFLLGHSGTAKTIAFVAIFILINRIFSLVFWLASRIFRFVKFIPFLSSIDKVGGLILGLVEGVLIVGVSIYAVAKFLPPASWLVGALSGSRIAHTLVFLVQFLTGFFS